MPELLDPADPGRRDRQVTAAPRPRTSPAPVAPPAPPDVPAEPLLLCSGVSKWYGHVIGVNGAGKTTLMRLITGHLRPDLGQVSIRGQDSWTAAAKRLVGYCPDVD